MYLSTHHSLLLPLLEGAKVGEYFEGRAPFLELQFPVEHDGGGDNDEMGTPVAPEGGRGGREGEGREGGEREGGHEF